MNVLKDKTEVIIIASTSIQLTVFGSVYPPPTDQLTCFENYDPRNSPDQEVHRARQREAQVVLCGAGVGPGLPELLWQPGQQGRQRSTIV